MTINKKNQQFQALMNLLSSKSKSDQRKAELVIVIFIEKYKDIITTNERNELFKYVIKKKDILEDYSYVCDFNNEEREKVVKKIIRNPLLVFECENVTSKIFTKEERKLFINQNINKYIDASIRVSTLDKFNLMVRENLNRDSTNYLVDTIFNRRKPFSISFVNSFISEVEKGYIMVTRDDYEKLMSVKVMNELFG